MGAPIFFMGLALDQTGFLHPQKQRGYGIRVAAHEASEVPLGQSPRVALQQCPQDRKLVWSDLQMSDAPTKRLVQPIPSPSEKERQAASFRSVDGQGDRRPSFARTRRRDSHESAAFTAAPGSGASFGCWGKPSG
jgi:hypothetical protein